MAGQRVRSIFGLLAMVCGIFLLTDAGSATTPAAFVDPKCWGRSEVIATGNVCPTCTYQVSAVVQHDPTCEVGCAYVATAQIECTAFSQTISRSGTLDCASDKDVVFKCPTDTGVDLSSGKVKCSACLEVNPWVPQ